MIQYEMTLTQPYRYASILERLKHASNRVLFYVQGERISRLHKLYDSNQSPAAEPIVATVMPGKNGDKLMLVCETGHEGHAESIYRSWRHMLGIVHPLEPFYSFIQTADPILDQIVKQLYGYQVLRDASLYESLLCAIIGQQVNLSFAANLKLALLETAGTYVKMGDQNLYAFPTPADVAKLDVKQLKERKFSARKAEYIIQTAQAIATGQLNITELQNDPDEVVIEKLTSLRGVGRWTAECVLMFGAGRPNLLPAADIGLRNSIRVFYGLNHQPTEEEVRQIGARWQPWQSYATYYLWAALDGYRKGSVHIPNP